MADRVLMITWGQSIPGREQRGLEVFNEALGYYGELRSAGRLERMDVCLNAPNGFMDGFIMLQGSAEQLTALREEARHQQLTVEAGLVVEDLRHIDGVMGDELAHQMGMYQEAISHVAVA